MASFSNAFCQPLRQMWHGILKSDMRPFAFIPTCKRVNVVITGTDGRPRCDLSDPKETQQGVAVGVHP